MWNSLVVVTAAGVAVAGVVVIDAVVVGSRRRAVPKQQTRKKSCDMYVLFSVTDRRTKKQKKDASGLIHSHARKLHPRLAAQKKKEQGKTAAR